MGMELPGHLRAEGKIGWPEADHDDGNDAQHEIKCARIWHDRPPLRRLPRSTTVDHPTFRMLRALPTDASLSAAEWGNCIHGYQHTRARRRVRSPQMVVLRGNGLGRLAGRVDR